MWLCDWLWLLPQVMAIGLSVDYCVHIAHRFNDVHQGALADATPGEIISAKESAIYALVTMGSSVMKGGFTTCVWPAAPICALCARCCGCAF